MYRKLLVLLASIVSYLKSTGNALLLRVSKPLTFYAAKRSALKERPTTSAQSTSAASRRLMRGRIRICDDRGVHELSTPNGWVKKRVVAWIRETCQAPNVKWVKFDGIIYKGKYDDRFNDGTRDKRSIYGSYPASAANRFFTKRHSR